MFHEVKVFSQNGKLKKVVSSHELSQAYWKRFGNSEDKIGLTTTARANVPRWVKDRLDLEFPDFKELGSRHLRS